MYQIKWRKICPRRHALLYCTTWNLRFRRNSLDDFHTLLDAQGYRASVSHLCLTLMNTPNTPLIAHVSHVLLRQSSRHSPDSYPRLVSGSVRAAWRWADWAFVLQNFYRSRTVTALTFRFWRPSICYSLYYGVLRDRDPLTSKSENEQG